jgi:SagB-type dehydrogenase family enzyme
MKSSAQLALGRMGQARPKPILSDLATDIDLPDPERSGGMPVMEAIANRRSSRAFSSKELPAQVLSNLLWSAYGINRADGHRTAPSAINAQEIDLYVALPSGAYLYDAAANSLRIITSREIRSVTGYQDFVAVAPLDIVFVANYARMKMIAAREHESFAAVTAGAIAQNVYLFAASAGLATVIRAWIDREAVANALGLDHDQHVVLSQTVGFPPD